MKREICKFSGPQINSISINILNTSLKIEKVKKRKGGGERAWYLEINLEKDMPDTYGEKCKPPLRDIKENLHQWREMYVLTPGETH